MPYKQLVQVAHNSQIMKALLAVGRCRVDVFLAVVSAVRQDIRRDYAKEMEHIQEMREAPFGLLGLTCCLCK